MQPLSIARRLTPRCASSSAKNTLRKSSRRTFFSSSSSSSASSPSSSASGAGNGAHAHAHMGPLAGVMQELDRIAPRFEMGEGDVEVLEGPVEFWECLTAKISRAKRRIYLATLYIGKEEHELIQVIRTALQRNPDLRISFLTDALRGTRETPKATTASLLAPLITEFGPERVQVRMYHTPNLVGARKLLLPKRINEGWGLQHMKLYGIDDELIMSGANLSKDYFTNRQDRYHVLKSAELTEYYAAIHAAVAQLSFDVQPASTPAGYALAWPSESPAPSPIAAPRAFTYTARSLLAPLIAPGGRDVVGQTTSLKAVEREGDAKTYIYPLFQLTPLLPSPRGKDPTTSTEYPALLLLLRALAAPPLAPARWTFTAGYFNPSADITSLLLATCTPTPHQGASGQASTQARTQPPTQSSGEVITAHPHANGFHASRGISGMLPPAYTLLAHRFLLSATSIQAQLKMLEWRRGNVAEGGWSYHAKGLWITLCGEHSRAEHSQDKSQDKARDKLQEEGPCITLVGSSNYTARSQTLDLEANALVVTREAGLMRRLGVEEGHLKKYASAVGLEEYEKDERRVGWWVRAAMWVVGAVGGAL